MRFANQIVRHSLAAIGVDAFETHVPQPSTGEIIRLRDGGAVALRPVRPEDAEQLQQFVRGLSAGARRRRFFGPLRELSREQLDRITRGCDPRDLALVAVAANGPEAGIIALAQYAVDEASAAELAVVVADNWQRNGIAGRLLDALFRHAVRAGIQLLHGLVLAENGPMLALAAKLGFAFEEDGDPDLVRIARPIAG